MDDVRDINILHLTDLHLTSRAAHAKDQDVVVEALFDDLDRMIVGGLKPDLVVFGGDLANDADENGIYYTAVETFIEPLLQKTRLTSEFFLIVPGNHDASRRVIQSSAAQHREFAFSDELPQINALYETQAFTEMQERKFAPYADTLELIGMDAFPWKRGYTAYQYPTLGVTFFLLNTAVTTAGGLSEVNKEDYGHLLVPEHAVLQMCRDARSIDQCTFLIAHHPADWFKPECRHVLERELNASFDAVFAGHVHETDPKQVGALSGSCLYLQTGALYQGRDHWNGYTLTRVNPEARAFEVHARRYSKDGNKFVKAVEIGEEGIFYPSGSSRAYWRARPVINREELARWILSSLKPTFIERHGETIVGRSLDQIFYEHPMQTRLPDDESGSSLNAGDIDSNSAGYERILKSAENYAIFGDTNYGKSSLLKRLGLALIDASASPELLSIPSLIEFTTITKSGDGVLKAIRASLPGIEEHNSLRSLLNEGLLTVLVDDVNSSDRIRMDQLSTFCASYPRVRYIFTSRQTQGLTVGIVANLGGAVSFKEVVLLPLKTRQIRRFTELYHAELDAEQCAKITSKVIETLKQTALPPTAFAVSVLYEVLGSLSGDVMINQVTLIERFIEYLLAKGKLIETRRATFDFDDKVDCLAHIASSMARAGEYDLTYDDTLNIVKSYIESVGYPYEPGQILRHFVDQKILKINDQGFYRFYLRAFLEFFIAKAMRRDAVFRDWVLSEERYLSFVHEVDFYSGLNRSDEEVLTLVASRHSAMLGAFRSQVGAVDINGFDNLRFPSDKSGADHLSDLQEKLATPALTRDEKDSLVDTQLAVNTTQQDAFRPNAADPPTRHFLSLMLYSSVLRNLGHLPAPVKQAHFDLVMEGWIEYLSHSFSIIEPLVRLRSLRINGVEYRVFARSTISNERLTRMLMLHMPTGVSSLIHTYLGSEKMVRQVEPNQGEDMPTITRLLRLFLLADLDASEWIAEFSQLRSTLKGKTYLSGASVWKLNSILKMRGLPLAKAERVADVAAYLFAEQSSSDPEEVRKLFTQRRNELRLAITVQGMKDRADNDTDVRIAMISAPRGGANSSP